MVPKHFWAEFSYCCYPWHGGFGAHIPLYDDAKDARGMWSNYTDADLLLIEYRIPLATLRACASRADVSEWSPAKWMWWDHDGIDCYDGFVVHVLPVDISYDIEN